MDALKSILVTTFRLLTFRANQEELRNLGSGHLAFGLVCTWLVGIGRWWDDPEAKLFQHLGVGSVGYVFVLALLTYLLVRPLRPQNWWYFGVLTYITLTSPPAVLYALPVERWVGYDAATALNLGFLALVAVWRVALLMRYLYVVGELRTGAWIVGLLFPLMLTLAALSFFNLMTGIVQVMSGYREGSASDAAQFLVFILGTLSLYGAIPIGVWYGLEIAAANRSAYEK